VDVVCHRQQQQQPTQPTVKIVIKKQYNQEISLQHMKKERIAWEAVEKTASKSELFILLRLKNNIVSY
jgi:hypothetical protein